jgi:hypothetical protein
MRCFGYQPLLHREINRMKTINSEAPADEQFFKRAFNRPDVVSSILLPSYFCD